MIDIADGCLRILRDCLGVREGEEVLIVSDPPKLEIAKALFFSARLLEAEPVLITMRETGRNGAEPPRVVAESMKECEVFIAPTTYSISHTEARRRATERGARGATMPGVTKEMFKGPLRANYSEISSITDRVADVLDSGNEVVIESENGTSLSLDISGRRAMRDKGIYLNPGEWGNLPAGEACLAPVSAEGTLVIDRMGNLITTPSEIKIRDGRAFEFKGESKKLEKILREVDENAFMVAELGIGTNPLAEVRGIILEDEKALGTVHIAFGDSRSFPGGDIASDIHIDGVILNPTLKVDGEVILSGGELLL